MLIIFISVDISFAPPGPSGLVQQCRPSSTIVPKPPLVISDSDSEEDEGLVSRLIPASCVQEPAAHTEGISTTRNPAVMILSEIQENLKK